ncbi:hypothetical protein IW261DRAFT_1571084 [Armillaria novae-zelandiae]|uniref:Uncharacterized protein n=1 Tax=Armillaria novae-zelandiae TaxID=153914 RepID=A0AA39NVA8_9AGAR|nr:hypothetical protein IW261DRAFT_1571084 [Armillaria novae-zelandiae]
MPFAHMTAKKTKQIQQGKRSADKLSASMTRSKCVKVAGGEPETNDDDKNTMSDFKNLTNIDFGTTTAATSSTQSINSLSLEEVSIPNDPINGIDNSMSANHNNGSHILTPTDKHNKPPPPEVEPDGVLVCIPNMTEGDMAISVDTGNHVHGLASTAITANKENDKPDNDSDDVINTAATNETVLLPFFKKLLATLKAIPILPHMKELGVAYGDPDPCLIIPFNLADEFAGNTVKVKRLLNFAFKSEGHNMQNLFSAVTRQYKYLVINPKNDGRKIVYAKNNKEATFFLIGKVTICNLATGEYNKEIDIQPMGCQWPRCVTVLAQILKFNDPLVAVYKDGITFSTYRMPGDGQKEPTIKKIHMDGIHHGPSIHAWNMEGAYCPKFAILQQSPDIVVLMYCGEDVFALTHYPKLPRADEFGIDSFVLVAFTVGGYRTCEDFERVSLNVQFIIGLEEQLPHDVGEVTDDTLIELRDETPIGVDDITPMRLVLESFDPVDIKAISGGPIM